MPWSMADDLTRSDLCERPEAPPRLFLAPPPARLERRDEQRVLARERALVEEHLAHAHDGRGHAFVVLGAPGSGKSTVVRDAVMRGSDRHVVRLEAAASERDLPYAGVHQLCMALAEQVHDLPDPQRGAIDVALGRGVGEVDPFLVAVAVLGLLAGAGGGRTTVCTVEDVHLLDPASLEVLAFVAHRVAAEPVVLVLVAGQSVAALQDLPEVRVRPLSAHESLGLIAGTYPGCVPEWVQERIVAEGRGNPGALLMLAAEVAGDAGAGGFGLPAPPSDDAGPARLLLGPLAPLGTDTRRALLVAAALLDGDADRFWRALAALGIDRTAADDAASHHLLDFGARVTFRDPHLRHAVYGGATFGERRLVHGVLADLGDSPRDLALRAWHLSHTTLEPDEGIADALVHAVDEARAAGGEPGAAAFLDRAAQLTRNPGRRARRALAAALVEHDRGDHDAASRLAHLADDAVLDEVSRARCDQLRAELAWAEGDRDAIPAMTESARTLQALDVALGRDAHLATLEATVAVGRLGAPGGAQNAGGAARSSAQQTPTDATGLLLDGLATLMSDTFAAAAPTLVRSVKASHQNLDSRWLRLAGRVAAEVWDDEAERKLMTRRMEAARDQGALADLAHALDELGAVYAHAGELEVAAGLVREATAVAQRAGVRPATIGPMVLAAWQGAESRTADLVETTRRLAISQGRGELLGRAEYAAAVLGNGLGRYDTVLENLPHTGSYEELLSSWMLPELIEAAARAGESVLARTMVGRLLERTGASRSSWALGIEARARALVADGPMVEKLYHGAIRNLGASPLTAQRARAHLLYGEWLRRERRRVDARGQLRIALDLFTSMGATAFASRASRELSATGERARKRTVETTGDLTPREEEISRLASEGVSNPQIASRLFISTRTVEYHLHKVFTKLGITSRGQLEWSLAPRAAEGQAR